MNRSLITMRLRAVRCDLTLESLERRQVMSAPAVISPFSSAVGFAAAETSTVGSTVVSGPLSKISVSPGNGQVFSVGSAPQSIVVGVTDPRLANVPINLLCMPGNIALYRVGLNGENVAVPVEVSSIPSGLGLDSTANMLTLSITSSLGPGRYRIVLTGGDNTLSQRVDDGSWDFTQDQTLGEFEVMGAAATLNDAVKIGGVGPDIQTVPGYLDLQAGGVALYKITLGTSQPLWRLGLQLDADRIGSPLRGALTLFDQQGRAIKASDTGTGLGTNPLDPYLFAALKPGVYYVGVSGAGNLGGQPGGYDPTTGDFGVNTVATASGPFQLEVVADPLKSNTEVSSFSLLGDDEASTHPPGFTITFSDAIDPNSLKGDSLYVQDGQGRTYPLVFDSFDPELNQLTYLFPQYLPAGDFSLVSASNGGLVDLVGRTPIAAGLPAGTLATWTVQPSSGSALDETVPVTFSKVDEANFIASGTAVLAGGGDKVVYRLVVPSLGASYLKTSDLSGQLRVTVESNGHETILAPDSLGPNLPDDLISKYNLGLYKGVYLLTLSTDGSEPLTIHWQLNITPTESPVGNAVGSAGALSLRMGGPLASTSTTPSPFSTPTGTTTVSVLPSSYTVTVSSTLVGRPSGSSDGISVGGPTVSGGLVAMAGAGRGLISGLLSNDGVGDDGLLRDSEGLVKRSLVTMTDPTPAPPRTGDDQAQPASFDEEERDDHADVSALLAADRLADAARNLAGWLFGEAEERSKASPKRDRVDAQILAETETGGGGQNNSGLEAEQSGEVERATLGVPVSLVVAAAAAFRFRQIGRKWWRKSGVPTASTNAPQPSLWRGPRFMVPPSRRTSRARASQRI